MSEHEQLAYLLELQAELGGAIPVERYIQEALYHPEYGYYAKNIRTVGTRGDFATSATLGKSLARAIAGWIAEVRHRERLRNVIEAGAGSGILAGNVLEYLGVLRRRGLKYRIVETSPVLRSEQRAALAGLPVTWHESMAEALLAAGGEAVVFSNELADAFPCRVFERRDGRWYEVGLHIDAASFCEVLLDCHVPPGSAFEQEFRDGQRVEIHAAWADWLACWMPLMRHGIMLTIDYGDECPALYHRRPRGTLRAYFHHQRFDALEVYKRFGRQDITADVNFTDLRVWGEQLGLLTLSFDTQAAFLARFASPLGKWRTFIPFDALLAEHQGAGTAFKVLIQRRSEDRKSSTQAFADSSTRLRLGHAYPPE